MLKARLKAILKAVFDDIFAVPPAEKRRQETVVTSELKAQPNPVLIGTKKQGKPISKVQTKPVLPTPKAKARPVDAKAKVQAEVEALRRMAPPSPRPSVRYDAYLAELDDEDRLGMQSLPETEHVIFSYRDAGGNETDRHVLVKRASEDHFQGYCLMRGDTRTFLYARIVGKVTRLDTGEILTKATWRRELVDNY